mmetsp:Transcript_11733/g.23157  ORF Transcript_11733/g.23157 Transcript_11733/m.23157 type:complete len:98 (+) Transcript_11733:1-294(+)
MNSVSDDDDDDEDAKAGSKSFEDDGGSFDQDLDDLQHASSTRRLSEEWKEIEQQKVTEFKALLRNKQKMGEQPHMFPGINSPVGAMGKHLDPIKMPL